MKKAEDECNMLLPFLIFQINCLRLHHNHTLFLQDHHTTNNSKRRERRSCLPSVSFRVKCQLVDSPPN
uniref:Ovule protein n=1 Tax=Caenorhabditis tropicalis TaxID=1561998 RepID=A0A1I7V4W5_9PELO